MIEKTNNLAAPQPGFGEYEKPVDPFLCRASRIKLLALTTLGILSITAVATIVSVTTGLFAPLAIAGAATIATALPVCTLIAIAEVVNRKRAKTALGSLNELMPQLSQPAKALNEYGKTNVHCCKDGQESFVWKKKLIESAEKNMVLSGNYCGGEAFVETLDLIEQQLTKKRELKVVIISSDMLINDDHERRITSLTESFPNRFQLIKSPDILHFGQEVKKSTNHTKCLSIDDGKYFLLGDSGLDDKYCRETGLNQPELSTDGTQKGKGFLESYILPKTFRSQDFVFHSSEPDGIGERTHFEALKLALRWEALGNNAPHSSLHNSVAKDLLLGYESGSIKQNPTTHIREFSSNFTADCQTKILCTGPEHVSNPFHNEILNQINESKHRIVIDHLYFHPTPQISKALIDAANRGVHITIITNGYDKSKSPGFQILSAPRSQYNLADIWNQIAPENRKNFRAFEFNVAMSSLHKKVVVVDDYVIAGSSNMGYKSLGPMSDHEMNFVTHSKELADQTAHIALEFDAKIATANESGNACEITEFDNGWWAALKAAPHRILAPLIG